ncbi:OLC1v1009917C1 [Oldenlandia corymbosa var. corymbosa]|uniref:OLC1v1009917C1 n=1 Tax=Oldenlandia corymbosa var. corymbosa TaxID=529605 RepID=A0AAV1DT83_OLDCO|nr:OLC1v1009917C1 [Oldenlandia corymbosa var. corymbosa]
MVFSENPFCSCNNVGFALHWQIFTIGLDSSWRHIRSSPFNSYKYYLPFSSIYAGCRISDGVLYWKDPRYPHDAPIMAFDFVQEKFRRIPLPDTQGNGTKYDLLNFGPVAVVSVSPESNEMVVVHYNCSRRSSGELAEGNWGDEEIYVMPSQGFRLEGILPCGKLLLCHEKDRSPACIYLFDPIKGESKEIVMQKNPFLSPLHLNGVNYYVEENIISLRSLGCIWTDNQTQENLEVPTEPKSIGSRVTHFGSRLRKLFCLPH